MKIGRVDKGQGRAIIQLSSSWIKRETVNKAGFISGEPLMNVVNINVSRTTSWSDISENASPLPTLSQISIQDCLKWLEDEEYRFFKSLI